ncbi:glycosyltransferase [Winogradskyella sp.]|jgi:cellulose synthase/poly-beta-1,6-N-acetylglucosamine synthase-like glycosyltransferase|uniref:glycosyltransferase family 2 protein n=1 Tax=Winogradskyella sp. TaxID=1883156 RepID=UPI0025DBF8C2|nr:glycosyltransferase [Winogradskyella sp.]MCT4630379.1 glycosyltransferase [Winogradskyella sp.]
MISFILAAIFIIYLIFTGTLVFGFDKVEDFKLKDLKPKTKFSIIIPFRNEANNLPQILNSITNLNYPKDLFEVIFVDDDSKDNSVEIIKSKLDFDKLSRTKKIQFQILKNNRVSNSPKKDAISTAIKIAKHEWIVTTDADCVLPKYWLDSFDEHIQTTDTNCVAAPVTYNGRNSFLNRFQTLDILSLQGATIGGFGLKLPFLCNGANFAYNKSAFIEINGFEGNTNIASGDDIFLLEKFKKLDHKKVSYLKSNKAILSTKPVSSFSELIQQRLRWASKTSHNPNWFSKALGLIIFLGNLVCIAILPLLLFEFIKPKIVIALLVIKFSIDFLLLFKTSRFFKQESLLFSYLGSCLMYPFFCVYIVILSLFKSYQWKGRTFKK